MTDVDRAKAAVHIIVHGEVQGVGFRSFVQARALALGVVGWVRNRDEGTVEIWAEGPRDTLQRLTQHVQNGPRYGLVSHLDINWYAAKDTYGGFNIRW
ncbi:MAG TPA: acylphosphatase [Anaerolineae bacterium]|nr:acylphosphatase [Anaerolineae bacterium]HQI85514.1 acylphosphatase [Anaerolineae bacterium]